MRHILLFSLVMMLSFGINAQQVIYDNGPIFNSIGTGSGGANKSVLLTTTFGMGTIGFSHQSTAVTGNYAVIVDDGFCADTSVCTSITVSGIDEWSQYLTFSPNPAGDVVNISIDIPFDETEYLLYDLNGRIIQHGILSNQQTQIHVGSIPAGVYSLSLMLNGYPINQKLIKQ